MALPLFYVGAALLITVGHVLKKKSVAKTDNTANIEPSKLKDGKNNESTNKSSIGRDTINASSGNDSGDSEKGGGSSAEAPIAGDPI